MAEKLKLDLSLVLPVLRHFVWNTTLTMLPWSSSPVGMCAGRWPACAHVHRAGLIRRMSPWALP